MSYEPSAPFYFQVLSKQILKFRKQFHFIIILLQQIAKCPIHTNIHCSEVKLDLYKENLAELSWLE